MDPDDLIRIGRRLASGAVGGRQGRPRQAELRRAVSATYYAMFHALALSCANLLAGSTLANRSQPAWRQVYRALEHNHAKNQCNSPSTMSRFPSEIRNFGQLFILMQIQRHSADYDPDARFSRFEVTRLIEETERTIAGFKRVPRVDQRAFAIYVLLRSRSD